MKDRFRQTPFEVLLRRPGTPIGDLLRSNLTNSPIDIVEWPGE
jgi:hypothetical protein